MSDRPEGQTAGNGAVREKAVAPAPIMIGAQYIKDLSFENPLGPEMAAGMAENPNVQIDVNTSARVLEDTTFEISLFIRGEASAGERTVFIVELTYGGIIAVDADEVPEENIHPLVMIEGPRHLFPFARAVIANTTRDGGFPPLMLGPIDFAALYIEHHDDQDED